MATHERPTIDPDYSRYPDRGNPIAAARRVDASQEGSGAVGSALGLRPVTTRANAPLTGDEHEKLRRHANVLNIALEVIGKEAVFTAHDMRELHVMFDAIDALAYLHA